MQNFELRLHPFWHNPALKSLQINPQFQQNSKTKVYLSLSPPKTDTRTREDAMQTVVPPLNVVSLSGRKRFQRPTTHHVNPLYTETLG